MQLCTFSSTASLRQLLYSLSKYLTALLARSITIVHTSEIMYLNVRDKRELDVFIYGILR